MRRKGTYDWWKPPPKTVRMDVTVDVSVVGDSHKKALAADVIAGIESASGKELDNHILMYGTAISFEPSKQALDWMVKSMERRRFSDDSD